MRYPAGWEVSEIGSTKLVNLSGYTSFFFDDDDRLEVLMGGYYSQDLGRVLTLEEVINQVKSEAEGYAIVFTEEANIMLDNYPAVKLTLRYNPVRNLYGFRIYLERKEVIYTIYTIAYSASYIPIFNQILSTFKFIDDETTE